MHGSSGSRCGSPRGSVPTALPWSAASSNGRRRTAPGSPWAHVSSLRVAFQGSSASVFGAAGRDLDTRSARLGVVFFLFSFFVPPSPRTREVPAPGRRRGPVGYEHGRWQPIAAECDCY